MVNRKSEKAWVLVRNFPSGKDEDARPFLYGRR